MATVTVIRFSTSEGATNALTRILELEKQRLIQSHDAAIVSWPHGKKTHQTTQLVNLADSDRCPRALSLARLLLAREDPAARVREATSPMPIQLLGGERRKPAAP